MAFFGNNIRKRVLATVNQRIVEGQAEFDRECEKEDERAAEAIRVITDAAARAKEAAETRIVSSIIG